MRTSIGFEDENPFFVDNFTSSNSAVWNFYNDGGQIYISDGLNLVSENSKFFPFVISKSNIFPESGNFYLKVQFKYLETTYRGVGFGFGNIIPEYGLTYYSFTDSDMVKFQVWQDSVGKLYIDTRKCDSATVCNDDRTSVYKTTTTDLLQHTIIVKNRNGITDFYFDDVKTASSPIVNTFWRPTVFWIGHLIQLGVPDDWTDLKILSVETGSLSESTEIIKTVFLPGLGASWDVGAILSGSEGGNWQIPNFVKVYDGLKDSFINAGYSETGNGKNLFIFPYDWRKPLSVLAERLNTFIETNIPAGEKVNLVGHSMGGLVARTYAQNYGVDKVNKVVTIGSPNMGTAKAYGIWEGATVFDDVWWGKVALDLTTHFGAISGNSSVQTIQKLVPSIKDLLPTYDYLKLDDTLLPWASLTQKNDYLNNLNLNVSQINSLTTAIYGKDIETDSLIKVVAHTPEDLDMWIDGKPIPVSPFETTYGDGTVTETSAKGPFTTTVLGSGWHGELVTKNDNIQKIFEVLELDPTKALIGVDDSRKKVFVAALRSPGALQVCNEIIAKCNSELGLYFPDNKFFMLPDYQNENLKISIEAQGELGAYTLHLGNINDTSNWDEVDGELIEVGQTDNYDVTSDGHKITAVLVDTVKPSLFSKTIFSGWYKTPQTSSFTYTDTNLKDDYQDPICVISSEGLSQTCEITPNICDQAENCNTDPQISNGANIDMASPSSTFVLPKLSNNWKGLISGTATDSASGVVRVNLIINNPKGIKSTVRTSGTTNWSYTIPTLIDGKYTVQSRAIDLAGNVQSKLVKQQITLDTVPPGATKIIFANDWARRILAGWLPVKTAKSYRVYYGSDKNNLTNMREVRDPLFVSDVLPFGNYFVSVTAVDKAGNESVRSNIVAVRVTRWFKW